MKTGRGYRILAAIADVYVLTIPLGAVAALYAAIRGEPVSAVTFFSGFVLVIVTSILYHSVFAHRARWLTAGERMHGGVFTAGAKSWANPYRVNRWALFALNLVALVLLGNMWDELSEGRIYGYAEILGKVVLAAGVVVGIVALGVGRTLGVLGPLVLYIGMGVGALGLAPQTAAPGAVRAIALFFAALALVHLGVALLYRRLSNSGRVGGTHEEL